MEIVCIGHSCQKGRGRIVFQVLPTYIWTRPCWHVSDGSVDHGKIIKLVGKLRSHSILGLAKQLWFTVKTMENNITSSWLGHDWLCRVRVKNNESSNLRSFLASRPMFFVASGGLFYTGSLLFTPPVLLCQFGFLPSQTSNLSESLQIRYFCNGKSKPEITEKGQRYAFGRSFLCGSRWRRQSHGKLWTTTLNETAWMDD